MKEDFSQKAAEEQSWMFLSFDYFENKARRLFLGLKSHLCKVVIENGAGEIVGYIPQSNRYFKEEFLVGSDVEALSKELISGQNGLDTGLH